MNINTLEEIADEERIGMLQSCVESSAETEMAKRRVVILTRDPCKQEEPDNRCRLMRTC